MSANMEKELSKLKARLNEITAEISETEKCAENAIDFASLVRKFIGIKELDYEIAHLLIEKIYVHEREVIDGKSHIRIDIYYRFIGNCSDDEPVTVIRRKS